MKLIQLKFFVGKILKFLRPTYAMSETSVYFLNNSRYFQNNSSYFQNDEGEEDMASTSTTRKKRSKCLCKKCSKRFEGNDETAFSMSAVSTCSKKHRSVASLEAPSSVTTLETVGSFETLDPVQETSNSVVSEKPISTVSCKRKKHSQYEKRTHLRIKRKKSSLDNVEMNDSKHSLDYKTQTITEDALEDKIPRTTEEKIIEDVQNVPNFGTFWNPKQPCAHNKCNHPHASKSQKLILDNQPAQNKPRRHRSKHHKLSEPQSKISMSSKESRSNANCRHQTQVEYKEAKTEAVGTSQHCGNFDEQMPQTPSSKYEEEDFLQPLLPRNYELFENSESPLSPQYTQEFNAVETGISYYSPVSEIPDLEHVKTPTLDGSVKEKLSSLSISDSDDEPEDFESLLEDESYGFQTIVMRSQKPETSMSYDVMAFSGSGDMSNHSALSTTHSVQSFPFMSPHVAFLDRKKAFTYIAQPSHCYLSSGDDSGCSTPKKRRCDEPKKRKPSCESPRPKCESPRSKYESPKRYDTRCDSRSQYSQTEGSGDGRRGDKPRSVSKGTQVGNSPGKGDREDPEEDPSRTGPCRFVPSFLIRKK